MCFAYKPYNEAFLGYAKHRSSYSKAMSRSALLYSAYLSLVV